MAAVNGPPGAIDGAPPLPKWTQTGMSASWQAAKNGSQWSVWYEGSPAACGSSLSATASAPGAAMRCTSAAALSTSQYGTRASGIWRPGAPAHHSSMIQSFHAETQAAARSLSSAAKNVLPANPGKLGKQ